MWNQDVIDEICAADSRAVSSGLDRVPFEVLQPMYVRANAFDVELDTPISRICRLDYLLDDVANGALTYVRALASIWKDPLENPLLSMLYVDPVTGGPIDLVRLVGDSYALCWTKESTETELAWLTFAKTQEYVRISTTPRKLLNRLMREEDNTYMFHHHIGEVRYRSVADIEHWRCTSSYESHLDTFGQGLIASLTILRETFKVEQEVRLLYSHMPEAGGWIESNVVADESLAKVPFDWAGVVDSIVLCPGMAATYAAKARKDIASVGIASPIMNSIFS